MTAMARRSHPMADVFPLMQGEDFEKPVADIKDNELLNAITLHPDGSILDGRNRARACEAAGVQPHFETWNEVGTAEAFVTSNNLARRMLDKGQCAAIAAELANMESGTRKPPK